MDVRLTLVTASQESMTASQEILTASREVVTASQAIREELGETAMILILHVSLPVNIRVQVTGSISISDNVLYNQLCLDTLLRFQPFKELPPI